jgi:hypothetical protein
LKTRFYKVRFCETRAGRGFPADRAKKIDLQSRLICPAVRFCQSPRKFISREKFTDQTLASREVERSSAMTAPL